MANVTTTLQHRLQEIHQVYAQQLPDKAWEIAEAWDAFLRQELDVEALETLYRQAHRLAGSGTTFGFPEVSTTARRLEALLKSVLQPAAPLTAAQRAEIGTSLEALKRVAVESEHTVRSRSRYEDSPSSCSPMVEDNDRLVFVVEDDALLAQDLAARMVQRGYRVQTFLALDELKQAVQETVPAAIIMDMVFPEGDLAGAETIIAIRQFLQKPLPALFISVRDDIEAQLQAVRAGATHYFTKPLNTDKVLDTLDECTTHQPKEPYRILLIDDDAPLATYYALALEQAGMITTTVNDPLQALETLDVFKPELILMDVYMPRCNGTELAAVIRQQDVYTGIPIVFLSTEADFDRQLAAMNLGGDDFLTKPVNPGHLVSVVIARVRRARMLNTITTELRAVIRDLDNQTFAVDQHAIVAMTDREGLITYANDRFCEISRYTHAELLGQDHRILRSGHQSQAFFKALRATIAQGQVWRGEIKNRTKDGEPYWVDTTVVPFVNASGQPYQYTVISTDITQRKQIESDLIHAKDEAEQANRAKSEFLSCMSHELRTPLNSILGFAQILETNTSAPLHPAQQPCVTQILEAGWHLLNLINDVLDLAKIEVGKLTLSLENVDLSTVLRECMTLIAPLAAQRHIALTDLTVATGPSWVWADHTRLKQVLLNILSNAVKYNREAGTVTLAYESASADRLHLCVTDTGRGIAPAQLQDLFKPFNRLEAEQSGIEGTGIGLAVSKRLMDMMGGAIGVDSTPEVGSTFWIELPVGACPETELADKQEARPMTAGEGPAATILYVEDNPANLKLISILIAQQPHLQLLTAPAAELGLDLARAHRPDVILLDINLPGMDGYKALSHLRSWEETREIPVLAVSANTLPCDIQHGLAAGFARYITKPIDVCQLMDAIEALLPKLPNSSGEPSATRLVQQPALKIRS